jgi:hypothetical protein
VKFRDGGRAIVCSRGGRRWPKCSVRGCSLPGRYQCDFLVVDGETCDRYLCWTHRVRQRNPGVDYCPEHDREAHESFHQQLRAALE